MVLIGILLSTPIISKAVNNMDNRELNIVFLIGIIWSALKTYRASCWGLDFRFKGWIFEDCAFYYFLGYFCRKIVNTTNKKFFYVIGIACFIFDAFIFEGGDREAPAFILYSLALFILAMQEISSIPEGFFAKVVRFMAKHSFTVYLLHEAVIRELYPIFAKIAALTGHLSLVYFEAFLLTSAISFLLAWLTDTILINPVQNILRKKWHA